MSPRQGTKCFTMFVLAVLAAGDTLEGNSISGHDESLAVFHPHVSGQYSCAWLTNADGEKYPLCRSVNSQLRIWVSPEDGRTYMSDITKDNDGWTIGTRVWEAPDCAVDQPVHRALPAQDTLACQDGMGLRDFGSSRCFFTVSGNPWRSWDAAENVCKQNGGHLASIWSFKEEMLVQFLVGRDITESDSQGVWIGAFHSHDNSGAVDENSPCEGSSGFLWADGSDVRYENWADGEPNHAGDYDFRTGFYYEECAELRGVQWNDAFCATSQPFVCVQHLPSIYPFEHPRCPIVLELQALIQPSNSTTGQVHFLHNTSFPDSAGEWLHCADERGTCNCDGIVRYGLSSTAQFFSRTSESGAIECSNSVFGDPTPGKAKSCWCLA